MIVRPTNINLNDWADSIALDLGIYGVVSRLDGDDWQSWGTQFNNNVGIGKNIPDPYAYSDWREWAERMCEVFA